MSFTIIDICILAFLALGAFIGFKKGLVKSVVSFLGLIISIILAWFLKDFISNNVY